MYRGNAKQKRIMKIDSELIKKILDDKIKYASFGFNPNIEHIKQHTKIMLDCLEIMETWQYVEDKYLSKGIKLKDVKLDD